MSASLPNTSVPLPLAGGAPGTATGLDVRVAAEFAADVRDMALWFAFDAGAMTVSNTRPQGTPQLPAVFTSEDANRPVLESLNISLTSAPDLTIPGSEAGALLWSESAVEKFLLPYYASVYGWEASALLLDHVSTAWFDYPGKELQVVALAYAWGSPSDFATDTRTLEQAGSIHVIYAPVDGSTGLRRMSLGPFLVMIGGHGSAKGPRQPVTNPSGDIGSIAFTSANALSSIDLRELAEFARGLRGQYLAFAAEPTAIAVNACPGIDPCGQAGTFTCATRRRRPDRPAPALVTATVTGPGGTPETLTLLPGGSQIPAPPDAIFWKGGALEKLMLPYYASVMGRQAPFFLGLLLAQWEGHMDVLPLSEHDDRALALEGLDAIADGTGPADTDVFAVIHLPLSEYVPEGLENPGEPGDRVRGQRLRDRTRLLRHDSDGFHADPVIG